MRRPPDDEELPSVWGLPAASLRDGESWESGVRRAGVGKLGVTLEPVRELCEGTLERPDYHLHLKLFEARVVAGEPSVPGPDASVTQYTAWKWVDPGELREAARRGSLCSRLYLEASGLKWP